MKLQSVCLGIPTSNFTFSNNRILPHQTVTASHGGQLRTRICSKYENVSAYLVPGLNMSVKKSSMLCLNKGAVMCASNPSLDGKIEFSREKHSNLPSKETDAVEPFRGKSGSISFYGLTHQSVEEGKLLSAPFDEEKGSFLWLLAPVALISSFIIPQFFIGNAVEAYLQNEVLVEFVTTLCSEAVFYVGLATYLLVTDHVQRPYLQFSTKRWGLITGLRGYLTSAFFTAGYRVISPLVTVYVTWPVLGFTALVSVAPFVVGFAVQLAFEKVFDKRGSSCWPLIPIIFEVYRLYQLTKADYFIKKLMYAMNGLPSSPELLERSGGLFAMEVTIGVLCVLCMWSLVTFLMRLFPSRPVAEKY